MRFSKTSVRGSARSFVATSWAREAGGVGDMDVGVALIGGMLYASRYERSLHPFSKIWM